MEISKKKRILIIKSVSIRQTNFAIEDLRQRYSEAIISVQTHPGAREDVMFSPKVNEVLIYDYADKFDVFKTDWRFFRRLREN